MSVRFAGPHSASRLRLSALPDRLRVLAEALASSFWPVPLVMIAVAVGAWWGAGWLDSMLRPEEALRFWWLRSGNGDDARNLLSTLLTAIITIASIVFSITIVTLTLAANQFGSRLVRIYMSDLWTKLSLGLFVMTVMYCLLALRVVEQDMRPEEVPHVTVAIGLLLAAGCVLVLVFFLNNVARSIVADEVIRRVAGELEHAVDSLEDGARPSDAGRTGQAGDEATGSSDAALLLSAREGYVQAVRYERLVRAAQEHDAVVELTFQPGAFMCRDGWLARVHPRSRANAGLEDAIHRAILIGSLRTPTQDLEYPMRHLIDVALRALSPGINDANTAMVVIDRMRGAMSKLMGKRLRPAIHADAAGRPRVIGPTHGYGALLEHAFAQIRCSAAPQPAVVLRLLDAIERIAEHAQLPEQLEALAAQAQLAADEGLARAATDGVRRTLSQRLQQTTRTLNERLLQVPGAPEPERHRPVQGEEPPSGALVCRR